MLTRMDEVGDCFSYDDISRFMGGSAVLNRQLPDRILSKFHHDLLANKQKLFSYSESNIAWSCAILHSQSNNPIYKDIFNVMKDSISSSLDCLGERNVEIKKIHDSFIWFENYSPIPNPLRRKRTSKVEERFSGGLAKMGYAIDTMFQPIHVFRQAIDLSTRYKDKTLLIEVDGPLHYLKNAESTWHALDGRTLFRSALCHAQSRQSYILRVPQIFIDEWTQHPEDIRREDIEFIFDEALALGPGAHNVVIDEEGLSVQPILHPAFRPKIKPVQSVDRGRIPQLV